MKIVSLTAENIKRLVAVEINPTGNIVQITGKNGQGKSSVLDAIWMALAGSKVIPDQPIREGAETGLIKIDLGDIIITRKFTQKGTYLEVSNKDGAVFKGPQKMLDELIGRLSFDPMAFMRMKPADQYEALAEHAGLDFSEIDEGRKVAYDERTLVNRQATQKKAELDSIIVPENAPDEEIPVSKLLDEYNKGLEINRQLDAQRDEVEHASHEIDSLNQRVDQLKHELDETLDLLDDAKSRYQRMHAEHKSNEGSRVDTDAIQSKVSNAENMNKAFQAKAKHQAASECLADLHAKSDVLSQSITQFDEDRLGLIRKANLPIEGLGFGESNVLYNGIPLDQASSAEQLRVSVAVAMAMNPKLRVIRIQDGSLLDSDSLKIIEEMASDGDYQFWVERVDESGNVGILIEDGQVAAVDGERIEKEQEEVA